MANKNSDDFPLIPCHSGTMPARDGDSIGITFMLSGNVHTPVTHGLSRTITTMCDHDIGVCISMKPKPKPKKTYELSDPMKKYIVSQDDKYIGGKNVLNPTVARSITTREGETRADASTYLSPDVPDDCEIRAGSDGYPVPASDIVLGTIDSPSFNEMTGRVHSPDGISPAMRTFCGGGQETKIAVPCDTEIAVTLLGGIGEKNSNRGTQFYEQDRVYSSDALATSIPAESAFHPNYGDPSQPRLRIRKLTPAECYRLMGFTLSDCQACRAAGQSDGSIYHQAGDSIVTTVLAGIFGELLGYDYESAISEWCDSLASECD